MTSPSPCVPQEILKEILDWLAIPFHETEHVHLWDERGRAAKAALLQCRFVSHSIQEVSSNHLFREVHITYDDEDEERRAVEFMQVLEAPCGGILRHVENLSFSFPNFLERLDCNTTHRDACDSLSTILEKILHLHDTRNPEDRVRRIRLSSLSIVFYVGWDTAPRWRKLTRELRTALTSVACLLPLGTLDLSNLTRVPPQLFSHLQAQTLRLHNFTPRSQEDASGTVLAFPERPLSQPTVKTLITSDPADEWVLAPLKTIRLEGGSDLRNPTVISQHAATIQTLDLCPRSNYFTWAGLVNTLTHTKFPALEVVRFQDEAIFKTRRRFREQPVLLCHYHPSNLLNVLRAFGTFDNTPLFQRVELTITLPISPQHAQRRPRCSWDYSECTTSHHGVTAPCGDSRVRWSDLDQFFHEILTRQRDERKPTIELCIRFHLGIYYKEGDPSSIPSGCFREEEVYWREVDWPNNSVAGVLPRLFKDFRDTLSFCSSFSLLPISE